MKTNAALITNILITTTLLSGTILASTLVSADNDSVVDEINITVPVSCTLSGTGMNTHNAEINNGQYNSTIGETTMKAFCNDNDGFAIYAIGYTDNEDGKNVLTSSMLGSEHDIVTGTATSGNTSNWAMKLSTITSPTLTYPIIIAGSTDDTEKEQGDPDYSTFQAVPDDYALVAKRTAGTDIGTNAEGATLKSTYQAYISPTQSAGTYTGQVKYVLVHPNDGVAPEKPEAPSTSCTTPFPGYTYMQDINSNNASSILTSLSTQQLYYLRDKRDNQPYCVAKLNDGKLWMTENLNIAGGTALSSEDTDFDSSYELPTTGNWTVTDGKLILPASATKNSDNNNLTDNTQFSTNNNAYVFNTGKKTNCEPCYSYYSWDTATLGSGRALTTENTDANYSVCPKNWKLPTSRHTSTFDATVAEESDFYLFAVRYSMSRSNWKQFDGNFYRDAGPNTVPNLLYFGSYKSGSFNSNSNYLWSSTMSQTSSKAYSLYYTQRTVDTANYDNGRGAGYSVRCLLKTN